MLHPDPNESGTPVTGSRTTWPISLRQLWILVLAVYSDAVHEEEQQEDNQEWARLLSSPDLQSNNTSPD